MPRRRHTMNPAKLKADLAALEDNPPPAVFERRLALRRRLSVVLLNLLSVVLLGASFAPFDCWYLAYVALAPWCMAMTGAAGRRWALLWAWLAGVLFWLTFAYWLAPITVVGYVALVVYLSAYWLAAALIVRAAAGRNWPLWLVLPVVWVALEYVRAYALSGFPWFYLAHSQYRQVRLIQIADLTGQYGLSFFVAMVNGAVVDVLTAPLFAAKGPRAVLRRYILLGPAVCAVVLAGLLAYGTWRLGQRADGPGPVIGLVQHAFPITLTGREDPPETILNSHLDSTRSLIGAGCDLVIWPETMLPTGMNPEVIDRPRETASDGVRELQDSAEKVAALSRQLGCPLLAGGVTLHRPTPRSIGRDEDEVVIRNSALWLDRSWQAPRIYSKRHLVPFSEYVPFGESWPAMHRTLRWFVPDVMPQLDPGREERVFELLRGGRTWRLATPICYEGAFDRVCRRMVMRDGRKAVDVLANLSNDGWFIWRWGDGPYHGTTEQAQHLTQYCFRAVENRVPVVRAVNTGISASIDSSGRILAEVTQRGRRTMVAGVLLLDGQGGAARGGPAHGPRVLVDDRVSLYSLAGDVFAMAVGAAAAGGTAVLLLRRRRTVKPEGAKA